MVSGRSSAVRIRRGDAFGIGASKDVSRGIERAGGRPRARTGLDGEVRQAIVLIDRVEIARIGHLREAIQTV